MIFYIGCDIISAIESMEGYGVYTFDEFEFESGAVLKDVKVEYFLTGTPKYDEEGNITNMVLYFHGFNGDYSSINENYILMAEDNVLSREDYFFVSITSLGLPSSCSPSTTGLKHAFPTYTIKDRVNFKRQFLLENFKFKKILGFIGRSLGGFEIFTWACEFPDDMEFIIVVCSSFKTNGYRYVFSKGVGSIFDSADNFYDDIYSDSLSKMLVSVNMIIYTNMFPKEIFQKLSNDEIDVLMDDFVDEGLFVDPYDLKFRNDAILNFDVESKLHNIKAKSLIFASNSNVYFDYEFDTKPLKDLIKDSKIVLLDSDYDDYLDFNPCKLIGKDVGEFLNQFKK